MSTTKGSLSFLLRAIGRLILTSQSSAVLFAMCDALQEVAAEPDTDLDSVVLLRSMANIARVRATQMEQPQ